MSGVGNFASRDEFVKLQRDDVSLHPLFDLRRRLCNVCMNVIEISMRCVIILCSLDIGQISLRLKVSGKLR